MTAQPLRAGTAEQPLTWGTPRARWVVAATVLGSGLTFTDATVVNIALPHIGADLDAGTTGLTWVVNGYTLTLAAFVLLGGSLGDRYGRRRIFSIGVAVFAISSLACGMAPNIELLVAARAVQGVGGALMTPGSLAILQASFGPDDRAKAIGAWSGLSGVAGAVGPFFGGWVVQYADWRWVFLVNLPLTVVVLVITDRHVPESSDPEACPRLDIPGALLLAGSLGAITYALTAAGTEGFRSSVVLGTLTAGLLLGVATLVQEHRSRSPMLPLSIFRSRLFTATNLVTFLVYAALGVLFFAIGIVLQVGAGYSPIAAGLALMPFTILMLLFSARAGALMNRVGPRIPMSLGSLVAAVGAALLTRVDSDTSYLADVLLPVTVLGAGITLLVTPLTATVLAAVPDRQAGLASGVNNAVARTAGLLAVAAVPLIGGLSGDGLIDPAQVVSAFGVLMWTCAGLLAGGAALAALTITGPEPRRHCASEPAHHYCNVAGPPAPVASVQEADEQAA